MNVLDMNQSDLINYLTKTKKLDMDKYNKIKNGCYVKVLSGRFKGALTYVSKVSKIYKLGFGTSRQHCKLIYYYYVYCPTGVRHCNVEIISKEEFEGYCK